MEGSRQMVAVSFALILIALYWIAGVYVINPFLNDRFIIFDDTVATYIDTMSVVDEGTVRMTIQESSLKSILVSYENEGKRDGYEIDEDGWYVIVTYSVGGSEVKSASRINTYTVEGGTEASVFQPDEVCVVKMIGEQNAVVTGC